MSSEKDQEQILDGIAIVGMSGRFPGAENPQAFWNNLKNGVESISRFQIDELEVAGKRSLANEQNYVRARAILTDVDQFDAAFFGIYPQEAKSMDPQHRVFLECCWEALEDAGYDPLAAQSPVGVFAGCSPNSYFLTEMAKDPAFVADYAASYQVGHYTTMLGTIADTLATRVAYKLNLRGPAITLLSACSTSLVAVCQACTSLLTYQCDSALAGGVSITFPQKRGYLYQSGGMVSPDGHCRTFSADAQGTVFGSGAGVVLLKRVGDAVADRDRIYAVIKGFATNNDGSEKVGFTAPSIDGQATAIATAQAMALTPADSISYIEAHGTATPLGDPIEVAALTQAFRQTTARKNFCALGTAKTNVGHLDVAAGVTGLIKTALSLVHRQIPPVLHFKQANPKLHLETSPFYVNSELQVWNRQNDMPLRAGVSAFGVGGTNAHVILEEAPETTQPSDSRPAQLLLLSARSAEALDTVATRLADFLESQPEALSLPDVAFTLASGRHNFDFRRTVVCQDRSAAIAQLRTKAKAAPVREAGSRATPKIYFLFPGQGSQYPRMGQELYKTEAVFRDAIDHCAETLMRLEGVDIRTVMYGSAGDTENLLNETKFAQPAIFVTEYALAQLWLSWGVKPDAMIGHSVGEFVAACLAGVFSLEDGLRLVQERALLMQLAPRGGMLSVRLPESALLPLLGQDLCVSALNAPGLTVVAGPVESLATLQKELEAQGVASRALRASHAFHSAMMDGVLEPFGKIVQQTPLQTPSIPYVSCVTGDWITEQAATDPGYWTSHLRKTVRFSDAIEKLLSIAGSIFLETGPGTVLQTLVRQHTAKTAKKCPVISTLTESKSITESESLLRALGHLWSEGVSVDWSLFFGGETRNRVSLPTYPFERSRFWVSEKDEELQLNTPGESPQPIEVKDNRLPELLASTTLLVSDLSGMSASELPANANFLELGFDSLFLTQVAQALQSKFAVKVAFSQLLDDLNSIAAIAAYLDACLPVTSSITPAHIRAPEPAAEQQVSSNAVAEPAALPHSAMERLMKAQLDAMSQLVARQLELLKAGEIGKFPPDVEAVRVPVNSPAQPAVGKEEFKPFGPYKPAQRGNLDVLSERQREYLNALIARYTAKTAKSKQLTARYRRVLADPRVASGFRLQWKELVYPITTNRSLGSKLWDIDGNEYIDLLNGFGPITLGHLPDFVRKAVREQLEEGIEIGPQTSLAGEVAELLCDVTGMERATFCNTGSEAVMAAIRIARTVTGRNKVVFFSGDYHGNFDEVLLKRGREHASHATPIAPGIPLEVGHNMVVLDYGSPEALAYIREHAKDLAAVLVEPVQSRHPNLRPKEFLQQIRALTEASETALIFDEIVTGFRLHLGGAQAYFGIRADLATYGKVLGGGFPIGAIAGSARFMDALDGGDWQYGDDSFPKVGVTFFAGTFVRHPLAMAAAKAVLTYLKQAGPALQEQLAERTESLVGKLKETFERHAVPAKVESCGSVFYFSFPPSFKFGSLLYYHLRERGVYLQEGFPCFLTTAHSDADLSRVADAFADSLEEMRNGGVLPDASPAEQFSRLAEPTYKPAHEPTHEPTQPGLREAPLTEPQLEILVSAKLSSEANCSYNESFTLDFQGELEHKALEEALLALLKRHEILRATFDLDSKTIRFSAETSVAIDQLDLSISPHGEEQFNQLVDSEARAPFDLENGPVVRIRIVKFASRHHVLLFTAHHIVCDGWSTNILIQELGELYAASKERRSPVLPVILPFSQYSMTLQQEAQTPQAVATEEFWLSQFRELPPLLDLPVDRPRPPLKSFAGGTVRRVLAPSFTKAVKDMGAAQGCTLFMTLLSGFQLLISRLSGLADIVVGIPAAGQSLIEEKTLVGHCVNFLPMRAQIDGDLSFSKLQRACKSTLLEAYKHQQYTFGTLVRKLRIPRDPSRLPLIEVQFNLERVGQKLRFPDLVVEVDSCPKKFVNFDLFLNIVESPKGLILDCDYNTTLFDAATIQRWLLSYETLLTSAAENPAQPLKNLSLLDEQEQQELIALNPDEVAYPSNRCVHELFADQVAQAASRVAIVHRGESLTYAELNSQAEQLANFLIRKGVGRHDLVAILLERSIAMVVGILGVLKAGAAYLPLDPTHPKSRLGLILQEASPKAILTNASFADVSLADSGNAAKPSIVCLDSDWKMISRESGAVKSHAEAADLAYVIYTSGSTGRPKGVEITHRAVVNFLCAMARKPGMLPSDRLLAVTTLSFDIAALEIFLPLVTGARVVIASQEDTTDGLSLRRLIEREQISILQATPSTWRLLLEAGWEPGVSLKMLCGGEPLPRQLADELLLAGGELWNMYGPTETTIWSAVSRVENSPAPVRIGPPIANTQFYVLDTNRQIQPLGVPGELYIAGHGLARGYFKRADLTAEKFVHNPFAASGSGARMYRTGDLVRLHPSGEVEFLGRLDNQIKLRGFRIELGEIESVLLKSKRLSEVVVSVQEQAGTKHLVAYFASEETVDENELKTLASASLPAYMVPTLFVRLASIPRTANGKIDRKSLPIPEFVRKQPSRLPETDFEKKLAAICQQVLGLTSIGVDDNLFELGADSIQIFRIVARANQAGLKLSVQQILQTPRIAALCDSESSAPTVDQTASSADAIKPVLRAAYRAKQREINVRA